MEVERHVTAVYQIISGRGSLEPIICLQVTPHSAQVWNWSLTTGGNLVYEWSILKANENIIEKKKKKKKKMKSNIYIEENEGGQQHQFL